jgi:hypothetical protein
VKFGDSDPPLHNPHSYAPTELEVATSANPRPQVPADGEVAGVAGLHDQTAALRRTETMAAIMCAKASGEQAEVKRLKGASSG